MHSSGIALLVLATLLQPGCTRWQKDTTIAGVTFAVVKVDPSGHALGRIVQPVVVGGRACQPGWLHLHANGAPEAFTTAEPIVLPGVTLPTGTWVRQTPDGVITVFAAPATIAVQGHWCRGTGGPKGVQVALYPSGALRQFYPPKATRIDGVPCRAGSFSGWVELHENGRLKSALLDSDWEHQGTRFLRGTRLEFDATGRPHPLPLPPPLDA